MYSPVFTIILAVVVLNNVFSNTIGDVPDEESERIVGGLEARRGQFPWVAALFYNGDFICTSTIVSPTTLLTAAHCVVFGIQERDLFYAIANVSKSAPSIRINFESITVHPGYNEDQLENDIAVLRTSEPIQISTEVRPVCIARPTTGEKEYRFATAMGWGNTIPSRNVSFYPDRLRYTKQKIIFDPVCSSINPSVNYERQMCATGLITGICDGDSGGPLVHMPSVRIPLIPIPLVGPLFLRNSPVAVGLASYVNNRTACGLLLPTVWTRLSAHYDFIMQNAGDSSVCTV